MVVWLLEFNDTYLVNIAVNAIDDVFHWWSVHQCSKIFYKRFLLGSVHMYIHICIRTKISLRSSTPINTQNLFSPLVVSKMHPKNLQNLIDNILNWPILPYYILQQSTRITKLLSTKVTNPNLFQSRIDKRRSTLEKKLFLVSIPGFNFSQSF